VRGECEMGALASFGPAANADRSRLRGGRVLGCPQDSLSRLALVFANSLESRTGRHYSARFFVFFVRAR